jgi:hypothetical protein
VNAVYRRTEGPGDPVIVHDAHGARWVVTERNTAAVPGARAPRCLVFMSEAAVRRVWAYPATWRDLSPDALLALSERP